MMKYYMAVKKVVYEEFTVTWEIDFWREIETLVQNQNVFAAADGEEFYLP